jgi:hypothetical protein
MSKRCQAGSLGYDALWIPVFTGMIETIDNWSSKLQLAFYFQAEACYSVNY